MTRVSWGTPGERFYETGVDRGVLYVDDAGVPWNGLISVQEKSPGGTSTPYYLDGFMYMQTSSVEDFGATIEAISSPREFDLCDGSVEPYSGLLVTHQRRKQFNLSYRTLVGNDVDGIDLGYKIHLIYNAIVAPSEHNNQTIAESVEPETFSWEITTNPPLVPGMRPTSHFIVDSRRTPKDKLSALEDMLYGKTGYSGLSLITVVDNGDGTSTLTYAEGPLITAVDTGEGITTIIYEESDANDPHFPDVSELLAMFAIEETTALTLVDNGNGTWTITGSDEQIVSIDVTTVSVTAPSVVFVNSDTYTISS